MAQAKIWTDRWPVYILSQKPPVHAPVFEVPDDLVAEYQDIEARWEAMQTRLEEIVNSARP